VYLYVLQELYVIYGADSKQNLKPFNFIHIKINVDRYIIYVLIGIKE